MSLCVCLCFRETSMELPYVPILSYMFAKKDILSRCKLHDVLII